MFQPCSPLAAIKILVPLLPYLTFILIAVFIGLGIWYTAYREKKRTEELSSVAEELGLAFSVDADEMLLQKLQVFPVFNKGRKRKMKNVMVAETEKMRLAIFDYQYTTGSGKNSHTHRFSVAAIECDSLKLPHFRVRPENFFDRVGSALGFQDIDFEEHSEFSDAFVLQGENETEIRKFFDKRVMDLFVSKRDALVDGAGNLTTFRRRRRQKPDKIEGFMGEAFEFLTALESSAEA